MSLGHDGGATNGGAFAAYADQVLVPALKPDDIVIMDNLPATSSYRGVPASMRPALFALLHISAAVVSPNDQGTDST